MEHGLNRRTTNIDESLVTSHNDPVTGLTAVAIYQNRVLSRDGTNNLTTSGDHNRLPKKRIHTDLYL